MTDTVTNTGVGEKEKSTQEKSEEVVTSTVSTPKEKKHTAKTEKPITKEEAVELFQSALDYMQSAGFSVKAINEDNLLILCVDNLKYEVGRISIVP